MFNQVYSWIFLSKKSSTGHLSSRCRIIIARKSDFQCYGLCFWIYENTNFIRIDICQVAVLGGRVRLGWKSFLQTKIDTEIMASSECLIQKQFLSGTESELPTRFRESFKKTPHSLLLVSSRPRTDFEVSHKRIFRLLIYRGKMDVLGYIDVLGFIDASRIDSGIFRVASS